jgi:hypothetical protein
LPLRKSITENIVQWCLYLFGKRFDTLSHFIFLSSYKIIAKDIVNVNI